MSEQTPSRPDGGMVDMMRLWFDMATQATEACQTWAGTMGSPDAVRQGRSDLYKTWGEWCERFMRSGPFLDAEKQYTTQGLEFQRQMREQLGRLNHELQLASAEDVDQLMIGVRRLGEDLRDLGENLDRRVAGISAQLDALAARLDAMEKGLSAHEGR